MVDGSSLYLNGADVRAESGFSGSAARWELLRRPIAAAVDRHGSFLDVGCANGFLMKSMQEWSSFELVMSGLDIVAELVELAGERSPEFAANLFVGDVRSWRPAQKYTFVHTELVYVEPAEQRWYVTRLLEHVVDSGGRLIVSCYAARSCLDSEPLVDAGLTLEEWGFDVGGTSSGKDEDGVALTSVAWIDN